MRYIALLRGVMPTGKNKVMMADLRKVVTEAGYENVMTYIQSGNIIFDSEQSAKEISEHMHNVIKSELGAELPVVVKTVAELEVIMKNNPYKDASYKNNVVFIATNMSHIEVEKEAEILSLSKDGEYVTFTKEAIYYYLPNGMHNSKVNNNFLEKKLGISLTTRNQNTMEKIIIRTNTSE